MSTSKDLSNLSGVFSVAGIWTPTTAFDPTTHTSPALANIFYSQITLPDGNKGLVLNGWAYAGWSNTTFYSVKAAILEQNASGVMVDATSKWLPDAVNNGSGSVIVADFNGDGKDDIFLAAHNESPFVPKPTTVFLSNASDGYTKITLNDANEAHGAAAFIYQGLPTVFVANYGIGSGSDFYPYYQYIGGKFVETLMSPKTEWGPTYASTGGDAVAVADFNGDGLADIVYADAGYGPGFPYVSGAAPVIVVYKLTDAYGNTGSPEAILTPYFNGKSQYANIPGLTGNGQTHTYRVWTDDFNHDGKPDIIAGASLWPSTYSMLQLFQNTSGNGTTSFVDKTDTLNAGYDVTSEEVDYSMQMIDIDHSGINTYFNAGSPHTLPNDANGKPDNSLQDNHILLNDGTGRLYDYLSPAQWQLIGDQLNTYLASVGVQHSGEARFIETTTGDGKINLVAELDTSQLINGNQISQQKFINIPLQLNPTVDYTENITVSDRNNSKLMRTWAGNDTFYDTNANSAPAHIDGGLGTNTSVYSHAASNYSITQNADGSYTVTGEGLADTLVNIQVLQFTDQKIQLASSASGGTLAAGSGITELFGSRGTDTGVLSAPQAAVTVTLNANGDVVATSSSGTITLHSIEQVQFSNSASAISIMSILPAVHISSSDATSYKAKVESYFIGTLGRAATSSELSQFQTALADNKGSVWDAGLVAYLAGTQEFTNATTGKTAGQIVDQEYQWLTGNTPSQTLHDYYTTMLGNGTIKARGLLNAILNDLSLMPRNDGALNQPSDWTVHMHDSMTPVDLIGMVTNLHTVGGIGITNLNANGGLS